MGRVGNVFAWYGLYVLITPWAGLCKLLSGAIAPDQVWGGFR